MTQYGSTGENDSNQRVDQTELPSSGTHRPGMAPQMRLQHKLGQAQWRMITGLSMAAPSNHSTNESYFITNWGAGVVISGLGADPTPNRSVPATYIFAMCFHLCICAKIQIPYVNGTQK